MFNPNINTPYSYAQLNPYTLSAPYQTAVKRGRAGGNTLRIMAIIIAIGILIGMALGLGLGIGAAGIVSDQNLTSVSNTTNTTVTNGTLTNGTLTNVTHVS